MCVCVCVCVCVSHRLVDKLTERAKELHVNNTALQSQLSDYTGKLNRERSLVIGLQKVSWVAASTLPA